MKLDGILLINKEKEYTSNDVVQKIKHKFNLEKVGHTGTLDPNATGVLPLLVNNGTKLSKYLINHDKTYIATLKLGEKTETGDREGKIIEKREIPELNKSKVLKTLNSFIGKQEQKPPMYSAIKVNGRKLYEYARDENNELPKITVEKRNIEIYSIELINFDKDTNQIKFKVDCSKGTYIRTLCEDIAEKLGTVGHMSDLQRTRVGNFKIEESYKIEEIENIEKLENYIITFKDFFKDKETINIDPKNLELYINGGRFITNKKDGIYNIYCEEKYIGIGIVNKKRLKREIYI